MVNKRKCLCNNPTCAKCLSVNCEDENCVVHTKKAKEIYRKNWERNHKKSFPKIN